MNDFTIKCPVCGCSPHKIDVTTKEYYCMNCDEIFSKEQGKGDE
jgi:DNA-directed RNA polymerase subunit RPC12/RpoP